MSERIASNKSFGGEHVRFRHRSETVASEMVYAVYLPWRLAGHELGFSPAAISPTTWLSTRTLASVTRWRSARMVRDPRLRVDRDPGRDPPHG